MIIFTIIGFFLINVKPLNVKPLELLHKERYRKCTQKLRVYICIKKQAPGNTDIFPSLIVRINVT